MEKNFKEKLSPELKSKIYQISPDKKTKTLYEVDYLFEKYECYLPDQGEFKNGIESQILDDSN